MALVPHCDHCNTSKNVVLLKVTAEVFREHDSGLFGPAPVDNSPQRLANDEVYVCPRHMSRTLWFIARGVLAPGQKPIAEEQPMETGENQ